jgi:transcriptional regulator with XRE-family HTH domain
MIGLEFVLNLYNTPHNELANILGIKKQNINLWIKGKQRISKKYIPQMAKLFNIDEDYFQKDLDDLDKLVLQQIKIQQDMSPVISLFDLGEILETEKEAIKTSYDNDEIKTIKFYAEKNQLLERFKELIFQCENNSDLAIYKTVISLLGRCETDENIKNLLINLQNSLSD